MAISADGRRLYLAMGPSGLRVVDTESNKVSTLRTEGYPMGLALTPDGRVLYVNYQNGGPGGSWGHDAIGRFDASTGVFLGSTTGLPHVGQTIAVSPDGSQVWANGTDACYRPQYDHRGCPFVPGGIINVI